MEYNRVNYTVIEECFRNCESKEDQFAIFTASAASMLDSELKVMKVDDLPGVLKQIPTTLGITNEKAVVLILSLHALLKEYISHDEETIAARFPDEFTLFSRSPSWSWRLQFGQWHGHYRSALAGSGPAKILPGVLSVAPALECRVVVGLGGSCACARREDCHATSGGRLIAARSNEASSRACTRGHACACTCR